MAVILRSGFLLVFTIIVCYGCDRNSAPVNAGPYLSPSQFAMINAAASALEAAEYRSALAFCDTVLAQTAEFAEGYFLRGRTLTAVYSYAAARADFEKVIELDPTYPSIWFNLGNNAFQREQYTEALQHYEREWASAQSSGTKEQKRAILMQIGRAQKNLGLVKAAKATFKKIIKLDADYAEVYNDLGHIYREDGDFKTALNYEMRALEFNPDKGEYYYYVGALLYQMGEYEKAIPHLRIAVEKQPWYQGGYYNLGRALMALGQVEEGRIYTAVVDSLQTMASKISLVRFSARVNSDRPWLWFELGELLAANQRYEEALSAFQVAHYLAPDNETISNAVHRLKGMTTSLR